MIDLRDSDKSRRLGKTEFNNCFIIRSRSFFFHESPPEEKRPAIFTQERSQKGEKREFFYAWAEYYLQPNTKGLFTWGGGPRSSGVGFFCFHALGDTKQKKLTPLDRGPPLHVNRV